MLRLLGWHPLPYWFLLYSFHSLVKFHNKLCFLMDFPKSYSSSILVSDWIASLSIIFSPLSLVSSPVSWWHLLTRLWGRSGWIFSSYLVVAVWTESGSTTISHEDSSIEGGSNLYLGTWIEGGIDNVEMKEDRSFKMVFIFKDKEV